MVTIYQQTYTGGLSLFPCTKEKQFKSHAQAHRYLDKLNRPYNGSCTIVTQCDYYKALRLYGGL